MHKFEVKRGKLFAEDVPVADLADKHGTPLYVYSATTFEDHFKRLDKALAPVDHLICYAMKSNSNLAILRQLARLGSGFDIVSGGELFRVIKAGGKASRCTFAGVGKTRREIEEALAAGVYSFNVESPAELDFINQVAGEMGKKAPVALRVNPNVDAKTHSKITTGTYDNKFGIAFEEIPGLYDYAATLPHLKLRGLQTHIGSQITKATPFEQAVKKLVPLVRSLKERHGIEFFDIGGGIGIVYDPALESGKASWWKQKKPPLTVEEYAKKLVPLVKPLGLRLLVEPGRFLSGNAGILVTEVLYVKRTGNKNFVIVDAAMNDLARPSMYDAYHQIVPLTAPTSRGRQSAQLIKTDVVGPVCESGDVFCKDRPLPPLEAGDRIALMSAGAYAFSMASNYNSRPLPAEILVRGDKVKVIRKRQSYDDLVLGEKR